MTKDEIEEAADIEAIKLASIISSIGIVLSYMENKVLLNAAKSAYLAGVACGILEVQKVYKEGGDPIAKS